MLVSGEVVVSVASLEVGVDGVVTVLDSDGAAGALVIGGGV